MLFKKTILTITIGSLVLSSGLCFSMETDSATTTFESGPSALTAPSTSTTDANKAKKEFWDSRCFNYGAGSLFAAMGIFLLGNNYFVCESGPTKCSLLSDACFSLAVLCSAKANSKTSWKTILFNRKSSLGKYFVSSIIAKTIASPLSEKGISFRTPQKISLYSPFGGLLSRVKEYQHDQYALRVYNEIELDSPLLQGAATVGLGTYAAKQLKEVLKEKQDEKSATTEPQASLLSELSSTEH